jgi:hypothetical protein
MEPRKVESVKTSIGSPRSWTERTYPNLIYFNEVERGGHFAISRAVSEGFTYLED